MTAFQCATRMEEALAEYLDATKVLSAALGDSESEEASAALETRDRCILRYTEATDLWCALPEAARDTELLRSITWHHHCITQVDTDIIRHIESLKDEVGDNLARIGRCRKMERSYLPPPSCKAEILDGAG